jgi:light-regulated signal transduction histidine kinase (bacteriophytochrome)
MQFTENTQELHHKLDREVLVRRITERIRQSLELEDILTSTVAEVRSFLKTDRIMIYRFSADGSGEVVAESINNNRLPSLKGLHFPADDIPARAREMYVSMRQRTIIDVNSGTIVLSPLDAADTGQPLVNQEIHYRSTRSLPHSLPDGHGSAIFLSRADFAPQDGVAKQPQHISAMPRRA